MQGANPTSYDDVPYESNPFPQTHPERLATVGTLLGLKPPPVDRCRVLELGCASGGNLIPMALELPDSTFMGIDLSGRQIADGHTTIQALGLNNIELQQANILDVTAELGLFDYIICHGVFSWVPVAVQEKILAICAENLSPDGIAYVSYNTLPGWHMRGMIRDMMCYHANQFDQSPVRVQQARGLLDFLAKSVPTQSGPFSLLLKNEVEYLRTSRDSYLLHDHLEEVNEPIYFYQFVERARARGLRFLGEAELCAMVPGNYPAEVEQVLQRLSPDIIRLEQYMDFLRNRMFRQTLLCHPQQTPSYRLHPDRLRTLAVACPAKPVSARPDIHSSAVEQFRTSGNVTVNAALPVVKSALLSLAEAWPGALPFEQLCRMARARLDAGIAPDAATRSDDAGVLGGALLRCYTSVSAHLLELHVCPPRLVLAISDRPAASPLARLQAEMGNQLTNRRHESVVLPELDRQLMRLLDGSRDRPALVEAVAEVVARGALKVTENGQPVQDIARLRTILTGAVDEALSRIASAALLVG